MTRAERYEANIVHMRMARKDFDMLRLVLADTINRYERGGSDIEALCAMNLRELRAIYFDKHVRLSPDDPRMKGREGIYDDERREAHAR